ncbi:MAG TPA: GNAT family N-acetyltransferase [Acidimicrobiia bacterium]|jgi:predicted acetyltransferase|nr:GNAT family N-acetyltransferase [Acidimicrobiia bacterium]
MGPNSTWFWEDDGAIQGVINVRHRLNPWLEENGGHIGYSVASSHRKKGVASAMLEAALERCRALDISPVLLICASGNLGSIQVIEANGGILVREEQNNVMARNQRWYRINL